MRGRRKLIGFVLVVLVAACAWAFTTLGPSVLGEATGEEKKAGRAVPEGFMEYRSPFLGISLLYPDYLVVQERRESATSYSVLFEDPETKAGFQIYVMNYGEPSITEERFRKDVPSGVRENETRAYIDGVAAVQFDSQDAVVGQTREVWVIQGGYLYEIVTYRPLGEWLSEEILADWRFL